MPVADWPYGADYLRQIFDAVTLRRQFNGKWPQPISSSDVEAELRRSGVQLELWEHRALDAMELAWVGAMRGEIASDIERHAKKTAR